MLLTKTPGDLYGQGFFISSLAEKKHHLNQAPIRYRNLPLNLKTVAKEEGSVQDLSHRMKNSHKKARHNYHQKSLSSTILKEFFYFIELVIDAFWKGLFYL